MMDLPQPLTDWFAAKRLGTPAAISSTCCAMSRARRAATALLVATPGAGKTLAGFLPTLAELIEAADGRPPHPLRLAAQGARRRRPAQPRSPPSPRWASTSAIETRTGDTPSATARRGSGSSRRSILLTTPRIAVSLLLSYPDSVTMFAGLKTIVVDEVHAFATGKRGDLLLSLCMARLQRLAP